MHSFVSVPATLRRSSASSSSSPTPHSVGRRSTTPPSLANTNNSGGAGTYGWNLRCHSASKVLNAAGLLDDFYTQCLDWGEHKVSALLDTQLLLFDPSDPNTFAVYSLHNDAPNGANAAAGGHQQRTSSPMLSVPFTAVTIPHHVNDSQVVVGDDLGGCHVVAAHPGSTSLVPYRRMLASPEVSNVSGGRFSHDASFVDEDALANGSGAPSTGQFDAMQQEGTTTNRVCTANSSPQSASVGALGYGNGAIVLYDIRCPEFYVAYCGKGHAHADGPVCSVSFSLDGSLLASGGNDDVVKVWSAAKLDSALECWVQHSGAVKALGWAPNVRGRLATGGGALDGSLAVIDPLSSGAGANDKPIAATEQHSSALAAAHHARHKEYKKNLRGSSGNGTMWRDDVSYRVRTDAQVTQLLWSPDGQWVLSLHGYHRSEVLPLSEASVRRARRHGSSGTVQSLLAQGNGSSVGIDGNSICAWTLSNSANPGHGNNEASPCVSPSTAAMRRALHQIEQDCLSTTTDASSAMHSLECHNVDFSHSSPQPGGVKEDSTPSLRLRHYIRDVHQRRPLHMVHNNKSLSSDGPRDDLRPFVAITAAGGTDASLRYWMPFARLCGGGNSSGTVQRTLASPNLPSPSSSRSTPAPPTLDDTTTPGTAIGSPLPSSPAAAGSHLGNRISPWQRSGPRDSLFETLR